MPADVNLPRETSEFLPVPVMVDGAPSTDFEVALIRWPQRPMTGDWASATIDGDEAGVVAAGLTPGTWCVWVRVDGATVVRAGTVWVD